MHVQRFDFQSAIYRVAFFCLFVGLRIPVSPQSGHPAVLNKCPLLPEADKVRLEPAAAKEKAAPDTA
jgi:hypothetical protein